MTTGSSNTDDSDTLVLPWPSSLTSSEKRGAGVAARSVGCVAKDHIVFRRCRCLCFLLFLSWVSFLWFLDA